MYVGIQCVGSENAMPKPGLTYRLFQYQLIDTDFISKNYTFDDSRYISSILIIIEYSVRNLNVLLNLKHALHSKYALNTIYSQANNALDMERRFVNLNYKDLLYDNYFPCLKLELKKMAFTGALKNV